MREPTVINEFGAILNVYEVVSIKPVKLRSPIYGLNLAEISLYEYWEKSAIAAWTKLLVNGKPRMLF